MSKPLLLLFVQLSVSSLWPLEIGRVQMAPPTGGKGAKVSKEPQEPLLSYHGVAYLDLSPLLYPGATSIFGVFPLHAYSRMETLAKVSQTQDPLRRTASV